MIGGRRILWITGHTQNIQTPRGLLQPHRKQRLVTQSVTDPPTQPTQPRHSQRTRSRQRRRDHSGWALVARPGPPKHHTPRPLRRSDMTFPPSKDLPRRGPGGCWVGCKRAAPPDTPPSTAGRQPGSRFSRRSAVCSLTGASSCAGPGGRTWRNTCGANRCQRVRPGLAGGPPARTPHGPRRTGAACWGVRLAAT